MHQFIPSGGEAAAGIDPAHTAAIRRWVEECLNLGPDEVVSVLESPCVDPGCPVVETVVAVFGDGKTRSWTFQRPRVAVTKLMVQLALKGTNPH